MSKLMSGGWAAIRQTNHELAVRARTVLCEELDLAPPCPSTLLGAMATIPLPARFQGRPKSGRIDPEQSRLYDEFGIEVPFYRFGHPERRYFRISAQLYNSISEYRYLARALKSLER
jgi:isopenicillin-N epimerase